MMLSSRTKNEGSWLRRRLDAWRDRRLRALPDRAFCRRVSLEGWERVARATDEHRGLLITLSHGGLPGTAERALALFASAIPLEVLATPRAAQALAVGGIFYAPEGSPRLAALSDLPCERLLARAEAEAEKIRVRLSLLGPS